MPTREKMIAEGLLYFCADCRKCYKEVPTEDYEDGHGGRLLTMCRCGCDLIVSLKTNNLVDADGKEKYCARKE